MLNNTVLAVKVTSVKVRPTSIGELVETFLPNGLKELSYTCDGSEMVVTNLDGEVYAMPRSIQ